MVLFASSAGLVMLPDGELIKDLRLPTSPRSWFRQIGGQLKAITITIGLEPLSGLRVFDRARWRKDWVKASSECALNGRAWSASIGRRGQLSWLCRLNLPDVSASKLIRQLHVSSSMVFKISSKM